MTSLNKVGYGCEGMTTVTACGIRLEDAVETSTKTLEVDRSKAKEAITDSLESTRLTAEMAPLNVPTISDRPYTPKCRPDGAEESWSCHKCEV